MEADEAISQAQAHLKNATELADRPVGKEELLYMWDNQITALDNFLADTETLVEPRLSGLRQQLRDAKKQLTDAVVAFEAKQEGMEVPDETISDDEWVEEFTQAAPEMLALAAEALDQEVNDVEDLPQWEEPLAMINGYLADSEPFQEKSRELAKARSQVRLARKELKENIAAVFHEWRQADLQAA